MTQRFSRSVMRKTLTCTLIAVAVTVAAAHARSLSQRDSPESYMPKSLGGVAVRTCVVEVSGKSTCGPDTLGEAALDSARLGFTMMQIAGLTGSDDKRWDHVVYGVTDRSCMSGGASVGAMRIQPGIFRETQRELDHLITSKQVPMAKTQVQGLDVYVGYPTAAKDCIMAFGYPSDSMIVLALAGTDNRDNVEKAIAAMLGAAGRNEP